MAKTVLVIEANSPYRAVIERCVQEAGGEPDGVAGFGNGLHRLSHREYDLVIWGVSPGEPGRAAGAQQLLAVRESALVLLDEAFDESDTTREAFVAGASHVLPKPFVPGALVGAIGSALAGPGPLSIIPLATSIDVAGTVFDAEARTVTNGDREKSLTRREWELLSFLLANPNRWFSAEQLVVQAWGSDAHSPEQLRGYVARLRRKLGPVTSVCQVVSRQGNGYSLTFEGGRTEPAAVGAGPSRRPLGGTRSRR